MSSPTTESIAHDPHNPSMPPPPANAAPATTVGRLVRSDKYFVLWIVLATLGASMASLVPMTYALALRIEQLVPNSPGLLGYVTGSAAVVSIVVSPLVGSFSDNTRSRFGRRAPWMVGGLMVGLTGLLVMALAPNVIVLAVGWVVGSSGWYPVSGGVGNLLADHLPAERRGRASALVGLSTSLSAVAGIGLASQVNTNNLLLFLLPGLVGTVLVVLLLVRVREVDNRNEPKRPRPAAAGWLATFVVDLRRHPAATPPSLGSGWPGSCSCWASRPTPPSRRSSTPSASTARSPTSQAWSPSRASPPSAPSPVGTLGAGVPR